MKAPKVHSMPTEPDALNLSAKMIRKEIGRIKRLSRKELERRLIVHRIALSYACMQRFQCGVDADPGYYARLGIMALKDIEQGCDDGWILGTHKGE